MKVASWSLVSAAALACSPAPVQKASAPPLTVPPPAKPAPSVAPAPVALAAPAYPTHVYFGDTHVHTGFSFDGGLFGATTTPSDAFRFARGETVKASKGLQAKLDRPLDFLVISDHSENLGFFKMLSEGDPAVLANPKGKQWYDGFRKGGQDAVNATLDMIKVFSQGKFPPELMVAGEKMRPLWDAVIDAAEKYNEPHKFTAFIGYEWTSMPGGNNLHRVVVFADGKDRVGQTLPFSAQDSEDPEKLWDAMQAYEHKTGGRVLAIPHNGNLSNGQMFGLETASGKPLDRAYAERRMKLEPLYEATQIKGDSEAHPYLSPTDELANFERWDIGNLDLSVKKQKSQLAGEYAREALKTGLAMDAKLGANPFKFGMIGSTDTHTGLSTADDRNFFGKHSGAEPNAERAAHAAIGGKAGKIMGWQMTASGYAAVWAHENTRKSLFEAMIRKETYATTGPRMVLRLFGGWDFSAADLTGDFVKAGYERGVPMGGDLKPGSGAAAPTFIVAAMKEPDGANLDRVQIVKGWVDAQGKTHEKVFDVAWSGDRKPKADGKLPPVGSTVDLATCTYANTIGAPQLMVVWKDPEFNAAQKAFYYVRLLEIPTPRWTAYDAMRYGAKLPKEAPLTTQERAYSSPIWYSPR